MTVSTCDPSINKTSSNTSLTSVDTPHEAGSPMVKKTSSLSSLLSEGEELREFQRALTQESTCPPLINFKAKEPAWDRSISDASSGCLFAESTQTLLFLDWDDTLFPTSALFETWGLPRDAESDTELPRELAEQLETWRGALQDFLLAACALSERCIILTNSKRPWVHTCVRRFVPEIQLLLEQDDSVDTDQEPRLSVVYAREVLSSKKQRCQREASVRAVMHETRSYDEVAEQLTKAKRIAMKQEAKDFYSKYPGQTWKNIISVGDMAYEHVALQEVTFRRVSPAREQLRTKALTVPTSPTMGEITARLKCARLLLQPFVTFDGDLSIKLDGQEDPLEVFGQALEMPEIRRLTPLGYAWGWGTVPSAEELTSALRDLARIVQQKAFQDLCQSRGFISPSESPSPMGRPATSGTVIGGDT